MIEDSRNTIKKNIRELMVLTPNLTDIDPYVVKLLVKETDKKDKF